MQGQIALFGMHFFRKMRLCDFKKLLDKSKAIAKEHNGDILVLDTAKEYVKYYEGLLLSSQNLVGGIEASDYILWL